MIPPNNCPYKDLTSLPCWTCQWHNADMDTCNLSLDYTASSIGTAATIAQSQSFEDRLRAYENERQKLLALSKEELVNLIIHRPTLY